MSEQETTNVETPAANAAESKEVPPQPSERLLEESKQWKSRALAAEKEKAELEKARLKEKEDFKALYEKEKSERETLFKQVMQEKLKSKVTEVAAKAGCVDVEALIKLGNKELLQFDDSTFELHGAETFIEEAKKSKPYLFSQAKPQTVNPATPGGMEKQKTLTAGDVAKLKKEDKDKIWSQLLK